MPATRSSRTIGIALLVLILAGAAAAAQPPRRAAVLVVTGAVPGAIVAIDGIRFGRTDANGTRRIETAGPGRHSVRIRQVGFRDDVQPAVLVAGATVKIRAKQVPATDKAELAFLNADNLAFDGKHTEAVALYKDAIAARNGKYVLAQIGLARSLLALKELDDAAEAVAAVIASDPANAEARTVSANILRERGFYDEAAAEYRKAIALSRTRVPEAHTGLAISLGDQGSLAPSAAEFTKAIAQNLDAEPLLYQLRGNVYERLQRPAQALADYMRFLALAPTHPLAPAVQSVVERLKAETNAPADDTDVNPYAPKP